jgi:sjoegren syndrome nuclear autoantigen 1
MAESKPPRNYNEDLINSIKDLKRRKVRGVAPHFSTISFLIRVASLSRSCLKDAVGKEIEIETRKQNEIQCRIDEEKKRLSHCEARLSKLQSSNEAYANTIKEADAAYSKILESSQTLLHVMKRESKVIQKSYSGESSE